MRRKFAFGLGLAGVLTGAGASIAQFAVDRPTPPVSPTAPGTPQALPSLPTSVRPLGSLPAPPGGVVAPAGGVVSPFGTPVTPAGGSVREPVAVPPPQDLEIRSALGANHPWQLKPEHGAFFICMKSYSRPNRPAPEDKGMTARELAEGLAGDIRELYKVQALLYEYVSPERKAEMAAISAARERARVFQSQMDKYRQDAQLKGYLFLEEDRVKVHYKTVSYHEQVAVLVGGFKTEDDARKALDAVRKWPAPKNKTLLDGAIITRPDKDGKVHYEQSHLNPYLTATVVPNPTIARAAADPAQAVTVDPFIVKLNEGRPYNLLKAKKNWTLGVKSFTAPVEIVSKDSSGNIMKPFGAANKGIDVLRASAEQAEQLAGALREMKDARGQSLGFEAFVLHTRSASIVTIGQFDDPNDAALLQLKQRLATMKLAASEDKTGTRPVGNAPELLSAMMPVPIPH